MKKSVIGKMLFTVVFMIFLLAACGNENSGTDAGTEESASQQVPVEETAQSPTPVIAPEKTDAPDPVERGGDDGVVQFIYRLNGSEHEQMVFFYENSTLQKMEYSLNIKGMPEEVEERKRLEDYSGVEMTDQEFNVVIEIDASAGGIRYLKDTIPFFSDVADWSWENVKNKLEENGYQIFDSADDEISTAR